MIRRLTGQEEVEYLNNREIKHEQKTVSEQPANHIAVFQEQSIRRTWHNEEWWFSIVDVCGVLTESVDPGAYWRKLKQRLAAEGSEVVTNCHGLKLPAPDGKALLLLAL